MTLIFNSQKEKILTHPLSSTLDAASNIFTWAAMLSEQNPLEQNYCMRVEKRE